MEQRVHEHHSLTRTRLQVAVDDVQLVAVGDCAYDLQEVLARLVLLEAARVLHYCNTHTQAHK